MFVGLWVQTAGLAGLRAKFWDQSFQVELQEPDDVEFWIFIARNLRTGGLAAGNPAPHVQAYQS